MGIERAAATLLKDGQEDVAAATAALVPAAAAAAAAGPELTRESSSTSSHGIGGMFGGDSEEEANWASGPHISRGGRACALDRRLRHAKVTLCAPRPRPPACRAGRSARARPDTAHDGGTDRGLGLVTHALLDVVRQRLFAVRAVRYRSEPGIYGTAGGVLTGQRCRAARLRRLAGDRWLTVAGPVF